MTSWSDHAIWWHLHPLTFTGAEPVALPPGTPPVDRLGRLEPWLDHLVELGCNGLALGPVFASESHGYDTVDHFRIDPRLGTDADFDALVASCRRRGVAVLLDGVFNHVGRGFAAFQDVLARGPAASPYTSWFRIDPDAPGPDGFGYADFEGHRNLVALDHAEPAVADHVTAVMRHWLDRGAAGWRLDAAYAVPTAFWHQVVGRVRDTHPQAWFVGEVIHGDYAAFAAAADLESVTQYELWKAIWSSVNDRNFFELSWALTRHEAYAETMQPLVFVGNHDVTRIASRVDDARHLPHALVVQFTVAGVPSVYAGDEHAFRGVKYDRAGGDAEIRPAFPADPSGLAPEGLPVYRLHQDLIGLRRRHPWLVRSRLKVVHLSNEVFAYRASSVDGGAALVVVLNLADRPFVLDPAPAHRILGSDPAAPPGTVEPHGWVVLGD